jgi:hypothetical protein
MVQHPVDSAIAQPPANVSVSTALHVGNGSGHFQQTLPRTYRQPKLRQRLFQPACILTVKRTKLPDPGIIQPRIQSVLTGILSLAQR